jgi:hypothetical protein
MEMNVLAGHALGDFLLQNRWLARKKQETWWGLFLHGAIVTVSIALFTGWLDLRLLLVMTSYLAIDGFGLGKKVWPDLIDQGAPYNSEPAPMWLRLIMDQAFHIVTYAVVVRLG